MLKCVQEALRFIWLCNSIFHRTFTMKSNGGTFSTHIYNVVFTVTCAIFNSVLWRFFFLFFRSFGSFLSDLPVLLPCAKTTTEPLISDSYINSIFTAYFMTVFKGIIPRNSDFDFNKNKEVSSKSGYEVVHVSKIKYLMRCEKCSNLQPNLLSIRRHISKMIKDKIQGLDLFHCLSNWKAKKDMNKSYYFRISSNVLVLANLWTEQ